MQKTFSNFEVLLMMASEDVVNKIGEAFMTVDTTDLEMSPQTHKKARHYIRHPKKNEKLHPVKMILVACLIIMSIAFTACVCIPQIREAITNVVVQWYDEYFSVGFGDESTIVTTRPEPEDPTPDTPPTTIEKKAYAGYLPEAGYTYAVTNQTLMIYELQYSDSNGNIVFILSQSVIDGELLWNDNDDTTSQEITVNGQKAYLVSYIDEPDVYTLIWRDNSYQYTIYGYFEDRSELIKIAESVEPR